MSGPDCCSIRSESNIKLMENARVAVFTNNSHEKYTVCRVDGCQISNSLAADFSITKHDHCAIVEFKGCDVQHAIKQINATLKHLKLKGLDSRYAALVVCSKYPSFDTTVQREKVALLRTWGARLTVKSNRFEGEFLSLF